MLDGSSNKKVNMMVKWDEPYRSSVVLTENGKFFVGTKTVFHQNKDKLHKHWMTLKKFYTI